MSKKVSCFYLLTVPVTQHPLLVVEDYFPNVADNYKHHCKSDSATSKK